ncbi:DUF1801 domain-containing protein [Salmonirosea aquatica]|uniref:DUF1801 domain-containing protein n=1 Tax=Salmonirosea aquatica TaxID=2654236 RepID=A0A7C9BDD5_9BACT|nr:DUF1801 domain-containing protein [Cytophagaceae bacterium SJW1-29]
MKELDHYFMQQEEPVRGCLLALREVILSANDSITPAWKWRLPFFYYKKKMLCYLSFHKKHKKPYLAIVEGRQIDHPALLAENRTRMKIMLIDPNEDLPMETIQAILQQALALY